MSNNKALKRQLFASGVSALRATGLSDDHYACPLCLRTFDEASLHDGGLTLEHVPPESQGGKGIILTCRQCNSTAGHALESHLARRSKLNNFAKGFVGNQEGFGGRASVSIGDAILRVDVLRTHDAINFKVSPHNDPAALRRSEEAFRKAPKGLELKVTSLDTYIPRRAHVADLKAAFLVLSAAFGYTYAASENVEPVRNQIANHDEEIMPQWWGQISLQPMTIGIVEPEGVAVVSFRHSSVVLPWISRDDQHWRSILDGTPKKLHGFKWPWPTTFVAHIDHLLTQER